MAKKKLKNAIKSVSETITDWIGTPQSIFLHTVFFVCVFGLTFFGVALGQVLLVLTTLLSIEAIYLALFIQMTVNKTTDSLEEVEEDIEYIHEDAKADDVYDVEVANALKNIENRLARLDDDLKVLKEKNLR